MTTRYIHIGSAKCASKSLQQGFFAAHPELAHLGMGSARGMTSWPDDEVQRVVEVDIRFKKDLVYDADAVAAVLAPRLAAADKKAGVKATGISFENLSCTMTYDVDLTAKARRLRDLFGAGAKIVFIVRDQRAMIRSHYAEYLASGANIGFVEFVNYMIVTQFRSLFSDLLYHRVYALYADLFGAENVFLYPLEWQKEAGHPLVAGLCDHLGIAPAAEELPRLNPSLTGKELHLLSLVNARMQHNFGADQTRITHAGRLTNYLKQELDSGQLMETFLDTQLLNAAYTIAKQFGEQVCPAPLAMAFTDWHNRYIEDYFGADNRALAKVLGPDFEKLGYPGL